MGGNAFVSDGLYTPRMPKAIYELVLQQVLEKLLPVYVEAQPPLEGPGKVDFGDIDVLVIPPEAEPTNEELKTLLGAVAFKQIPNSRTTNFALPWPDTLSDISENLNSTTNTVAELQLGEYLNITAAQDVSSVEQKYVQLDINRSRSAKELRQTQFIHAHNDLWIILRVMLRSYGITHNGEALCIAIEELNTWDKKKAQIQAIEDPDEILRYLELDTERFWKPFKSWDECMDYISTCRFYKPLKGPVQNEQSANALQKSDIKRMAKRPMFNYWMDEYLPSHRNAPAGRSAHLTREEVLEEAKQLFGPSFTQEYEARKATGLRELNLPKFWADVKKGINVAGSKLTYAIKGIKRKLAEKDGSEEGDQIMSKVWKAFQDGQFEIVQKWAIENWEAIASEQEQMDKWKSHQNLLLKRERDRAIAEQRG